MATSLSPPRSRRAGLLEFAPELTTEIVRLVDYEDIPALRLVCRQLASIASPFLLQSISVRQDQESLDHVEQIIEKPHLASGIRAIEVNLDYYRFSSLASDKSLFTQVLEDHMMGAFSYHLRCRRTDQERRYAYLAERRSTFERTEEIQNDDLEEYEQFVLSAYEIYKREYHEVSRIASDGSLIRALVRLASFTKRPVALKFKTDEVNSSAIRYSAMPSLDPKVATSDYMNHPPTLSQLPERYRKPVEDDVMLLDRIIWNLPIALHQAGRIVHSFVLNNVLKIRENELLFADDLLPNKNKLNQLGQALQGLTQFEIEIMMYDDDRDDLVYGDDRDDPELDHAEEPREERPTLGDLLRTCLSGQHLDSISLSGFEGSDWATWKSSGLVSSHRDEDKLEPVEVDIDVAKVRHVYISDFPLKLLNGTVSWLAEDYTWSWGVLTRCVNN
ncbi:unnamed protein product [Clonostachys rosea]|uniref:F-box domain-containing protein n=1 Tax=Bionectria ochroleuca TaxID=29856 RepID=A0ABY6UPE5_BIOOC|nr:unnamed protein product [Clonostachys rosea]